MVRTQLAHVTAWLAAHPTVAPIGMRASSTCEAPSIHLHEADFRRLYRDRAIEISRATRDSDRHAVHDGGCVVLALVTVPAVLQGGV